MALFVDDSEAKPQRRNRSRRRRFRPPEERQPGNKWTMCVLCVPMHIVEVF